ncbi:Hpt domain-containing protein [Kiloniella antarctica]|uniref:Hpt domain-containing protein n=1 Tax=Kiloniella antarctica TaxID=1550907 RepID=A0ABW5BH59_9PROT
MWPKVAEVSCPTLKGEHRTISQAIEQDLSSRSNEFPIRDDCVIQALSDEVGADMIPFLVERFRCDLQMHLDGVVGAVNDTDGEQLERESHTLKSVSGTFGAVRLQQLMTEINECCRRDEVKKALELAGNVKTIGQLTMKAYLKD